MNENELLEQPIEEAIDCVELEPDLAMEMYDYTEIAMASLVETSQFYTELQLEQMVLESDWIMECLECGFILPMPDRLMQILEADAEQQEIKQEKEQGAEAEQDAKEKVLKARASGGYRDLANAIKAWLDEIVANIRRQAVRRKQKYSPWLEDVDKEIGVAAAKMTAGIKMAPYLDGNWKDDVQKCVNSINAATNNIIAKQINDFDFCKDIVDPAYVANRSGVLTNYIKNYFRFGIVNSEKVKPTTLVGEDLVKGTALMIDYITTYDKVIANNVGKIAGAYSPQKIAKALQAAEDDPAKVTANAEKNDQENKKDIKSTPNAETPTKESLNPFTFINVEEKMLFETVLTSLINYESIVESGTVKNNPKPTNGTPVNADTGEKLSTTSVTATDVKGKELSKEEQSTAKAETSGDGEEKESKSANVAVGNYMKSIEYYIKLLISCYATACDERFITFINVLLKIADFGKVPKPKFDIHGNYMGTKGEGIVKTAVNKKVNKVKDNIEAKQDAKDAGKQMDEARSGDKNSSDSSGRRKLGSALKKGVGQVADKVSSWAKSNKKKEEK